MLFKLILRQITIYRQYVGPLGHPLHGKRQIGDALTADAPAWTNHMTELCQGHESSAGWKVRQPQAQKKTGKKSLSFRG